MWKCGVKMVFSEQCTNKRNVGTSTSAVRLNHYAGKLRFGYDHNVTRMRKFAHAPYAGKS